MRKVLAIGFHTLRAAFRSRLAQMLFILVIASVVVLPMTIEGDGTVSGYIQVLLSYSLGAVVTLLAITSVWVGCSGISGEIENHRIQMVLSKPVHRYQVWLGKWLGLLMLNLLFLAFSGATIYGFMQWRMASQLDQEQDRERLHTDILVARYQTTPEQEATGAMVEQVIQQQQQQGLLEPGQDLEALRKELHKTAVMQMNTLQQGYRKKWVFKLPEKPNADQRVQLRYRFHASSGATGPYRGVWLFDYDRNPGQHDRPVLHTSTTFHDEPIPAEAIQADGTLLVDYVHMDPSNDLLVFDVVRDLKVLSPADSFVMNYLRILLIYFTRLMFFSAIGLTMGALFSMPVATFSAMAVIGMQQFSNFIQEEAAQEALRPWETPPGWLEQLLDTLYRLLNLAVQPLRDTAVLNDLATGMVIPWSQVGYAFVSKVVIYAGLFALLGCLLFNRREIGRPEQ